MIVQAWGEQEEEGEFVHTPSRCVKMSCNPVLLCWKCSRCWTIQISFSPLQPMSLTLYWAVDLCVNRWLGVCPTVGDRPQHSCVSQAVMWMAWKGLTEERSLHSSLIKVSGYLQCFLVFSKIFRPLFLLSLASSFLHFLSSCSSAKGQEPLPPQLFTCGFLLHPLLASRCPSKQKRVKPETQQLM